MSLKQLPLASLSSPLKIPISLPQITTSTYPSHKYLSHSRYDNNHEKPSFQPPIPKNLSFDADTDLDSLPLDESVHLGHITSCENVVPDKSPAGDIPVKLLFTNPLSPTASQKQKKALLVTEEPSMEFEGKASPGFSTPTIVKEIDSDLSGSEIIQVTDANQVETVVFEQRKPSTANVLFSTLVPSRFALDVMSRNVLRTSNEAKPGDNRPKALSGDEGNQSIVGGGHMSPTAQMPKARRKWRQLSHVFHSITLIQKPEAASISQKDIAAEIDNFPLKKEKFDIHDRIIFRREGSREAFEMLRTVKMLCDCAKIGSPKHIEVMKEILANDIRKHLYEPKDADHLLNRYNTDGFPPLCLAAQNGNLEVVKMLIDKGADHLRETKPPQAKKSKEVALELAVRWNHVRVVEYLLDKFVHPADILNNCLKVAESKNLKEMLMKYMNAHNISHKKRAACYTK